MRDARARLMFSSEAREFLRSGDPLSVRTRPFDTVQNSADNSLSLRCCSSRFDIRRMVFLLLFRGPGIEAFLAPTPRNARSGRRPHPAGTATPEEEPSALAANKTACRVKRGPFKGPCRGNDRGRKQGCFKTKLAAKKKHTGARYCAVEIGPTVSSQLWSMAAASPRNNRTHRSA